MDTNAKFEIFFDKISSYVSQHVPRKKLSKREIKLSVKPWITRDILKKIKYRDKLYSKSLKNLHNLNLTYLFKKFRNSVVKDIKVSKSKYFKKNFLINMSNMKKLWTGIRSIINISKCRDVFIPTLSENNKSFNNPQDIANIFNKFFVNVGKTTEKDIPKGDHSVSFYLRGNYLQSIFISPVTPSEVSLIISQMNNNKSVGPNSIPIPILKILKDHISKPLSLIINDSFTTGIFPNKLKIANVTPIFKKGSRVDKNNYRPISVLPIFSKLFEKLMYQRLYNYLEHHEILYPLQFGFREKCSTSHALISISELIRNSIDNKEFGCGIFIDLKKAFDTVNHSLLLKKLDHYGIRGNVNNWFQSYLSQREQFVTINGYKSVSLPVTCGVPQGSVLGPLLFLLYINDLPNTSNLLKFHLFADDTNIYFSSKNLDAIQQTLNNELQAVSDWMNCNRLALNIKKTNFILFHSKQHKPYQPFNIKINDINIEQVFSLKYLGIIFDSNLTWKSHINNLCLKLSKTVGILSKVRYFVNIDILVMLYYSLIYPFLIYGVQIWGLTYPTYLKPISIIQKKTVRIITFSEPQSHSEPLFKSLKILKFNDIINLQILTFVFQWSRNLTPLNFNDYFQLVSSIHTYSTRQSLSKNLYLKSVKTTQYGIRSLKFTGSSLWNSLSNEMKKLPLLSSFRRNFKTSILENYISLNI